MIIFWIRGFLVIRGFVRWVVGSGEEEFKVFCFFTLSFFNSKFCLFWEGRGFWIRYETGVKLVWIKF